MKRIAKAIILLILWACAIPGAASAIVMLLWNSIVTATCGFAAIGFSQAAGLFVLGQLLSAGFILGFLYSVPVSTPSSTTTPTGCTPTGTG